MKKNVLYLLVMEGDENITFKDGFEMAVRTPGSCVCEADGT